MRKQTSFMLTEDVYKIVSVILEESGIPIPVFLKKSLEYYEEDPQVVNLEIIGRKKDFIIRPWLDYETSELLDKLVEEVSDSEGTASRSDIVAQALWFYAEKISIAYLSKEDIDMAFRFTAGTWKDVWPQQRVGKGMKNKKKI